MDDLLLFMDLQEANYIETVLTNGPAVQSDVGMQIALDKDKVVIDMINSLRKYWSLILISNLILRLVLALFSMKIEWVSCFLLHRRNNVIQKLLRRYIWQI
jgi:hypothetical protein